MDPAAPVLIKEITRRVHVSGMFQAVYTAGVVLPKPVAQCRYWHRSLKPKPEADAPPQMPMEPEFDGIDKRISGGDTPRDGTPRRKPPPRSAGTPRRDS